MSTAPTLTTSTDVSRSSTPHTLIPVPAKPQAAQPLGATGEVAAKPSAHAAPMTAVPVVAPSADTGCCHGGATDKVASSKTAGPVMAHAQTCHGTTDGIRALVLELHSSDTHRRLAAAIALGQLKDRAAATPLIAALSDSDADVARAAACGLGLLGNPSAVEPLINVVNNPDGFFHNSVRTASTASLGQLHDSRAIDALRYAINDPDVATSTEAIRAMAALGDVRGVDPILAVVRNADGFFLETVRRTAVLGLAQLGGTQAEFELRFVASNEFETAPVRDAAIGALRSTATVD